MVNWFKRIPLAILKAGKIPRHIAFIMDGNRRWAVKQHKDKIAGHSFGKLYLGFDKLLEVIDWCLELGISVITVFAFSTDNFKRTQEEVEELMRLFREACRKLKEQE